MKYLNNRSLWNLDLSCQENMNVPLWFNIGFQQRDRQDSQQLKFCSFAGYQLLVLNAYLFVRRLPVTSPQCIFRTKNYLDSAIRFYYDDDDFSQGCGQIKEAFRAPTKDAIFKL